MLEGTAERGEDEGAHAEEGSQAAPLQPDNGSARVARSGGASVRDECGVERESESEGEKRLRGQGNGGAAH